MQNTTRNHFPSLKKRHSLQILYQSLSKDIPLPPINSFSKTVFTQVEIFGRFSFLDGPCQNGAKAVPLIDVEQERPTICYVNAPFFFRILIKINGIGEMLWLRRCHSKAIDGHGYAIIHRKTCQRCRNFSWI